jgi:quercetin dioxygenase-like cupin family protein
MPRNALVSSVLVVVALLVAMPVLGGAQHATPAASGSVGVSGGAFGGGETKAAPGYALSLRRGVFEPGGIVPLHHHPGALVLYVESATLTYSVFEGEAQVQRQVEPGGTPGPIERFGPGTEAILNPGDVVFEQDVVHVTENSGEVPAVILIAAHVAVDQPLTEYHETTATPAP